MNTVIPGQMHTPMVEARLAGQRAKGDVEALLAQRRARIPLGFMGDGQGCCLRGVVSRFG